MQGTVRCTPPTPRRPRSRRTNTTPLPSSPMLATPPPPPAPTPSPAISSIQLPPLAPPKCLVQSRRKTECPAITPAVANAAPTTPTFGDPTREDRHSVPTALPKPPLEPPTTTPIHQRYTSNIPPLSVTQISLCNNTSNSPDRRRPLLACPPSTIRIQEAVREGECATGREGRCAATAVQRSTIE